MEQKKIELGLGLNLELSPSLIFLVFDPFKLLWASGETWME
jgi:hypothetical protein